MASRRTVSTAGFLFAVSSAACFALSGVFASALMSAGWTAIAVTTVRVACAALILIVPTVIMLRGRWDLVRAGWLPVLLLGVLTVFGSQLSLFLAVQYIPPSLAVVIMYTGPVLLIFWAWARTRVAPSGLTLLGAALSLVGLIAISGFATGGALHPLGVLFALLAAVGLAAFFAASATGDHGIPPLPFAGLGLAVGAVVLLAVSATGLLPFRVSLDPATFAGVEVPALLLVAGVVLVSTVMSYVLGVPAARRLGATVASFAGYSEPLFGILWTALLLLVLPTGQQWIGAALIVSGVVVVKIGEIRRPAGAAGVSAPLAPPTGHPVPDPRQRR